MSALLRTSLDKVKAVYDGALQTYVNESYSYNFKALLTQEGKLAAAGNARSEEIRALYEKHFKNKDVALTALKKMVKRVDKHLSNEEVQMKAKLRANIREAFISKIEQSIHEVLPNKELGPWPEL